MALRLQAPARWEPKAAVRSPSCEEGLDRDALKSLDYAGAVVRMATFKKLMKVPKCICPASSGPGRTATAVVDYVEP